ncbi:natriuretic peptides A-like isoform X2 [Cygnus olor]|uniref:natriuretic peptides A-like isoform X2 n=1 Tax=Cygnus olor TaxID=8869 RepID=UPI001ADE86E0|nr:natriuretic peptides A-like isoform X2 [Cygnus olor]
MQLPAVCCRAWLLLLVLPWAGAQAAGGEHGAELRSLQDLLEALGQLREEEGRPALEDEPEAGAEDGGPEWDLPETPLPAPSPTEPAEGQSRWRSLLSSSRRRHFSGCFGTRMERIGAQTGLGCNHYRARFWRRGRS